MTRARHKPIEVEVAAVSEKALLEAFSRDRALACATLFRHRHTNETPAFHVEMHDAWRSADEFVVIDAFREAAKSTTAEEFIAIEAAFENFRYLILGGETYGKACQRLEAIKYEIVTNSKLHSLFGDLRADKSAGQLWNEGFIELRNGVVIQAFGWEQEVRGWKHHNVRPDRCYLDDIENDERVKDQGAVNATMRKLYKQVLPAMDKQLRKVRVTGTPLADDCMIIRLHASSQWISYKFPICNGEVDDAQTVSLWPDRYPMQWIRAERDTYAEAGMLAEFNQEYLLIPAQTAGKPFLESDLVFEDVAPPVFMRRAVLLDPSRTTDLRSAETGYAEVGQLGSRIYVFESGAKKLQPSEQVAYIFDASARNGDCKVAVEQDGLNDWLMEPVRRASLERGLVVELKAINAPRDRDKISFITGLQPHFRGKNIIFVGPRARHGRLVQQLLNFPSGKLDAINALAFVQKVFAGTPVYPEFSTVNLLTDPLAGKKDELALAVNHDGRETVAALVAIGGQSKIVLNDWASALAPGEALRDIIALVKMLYPDKSVKVFVPAEQWDQADRMPLVPALRTLKAEVYRGGYASMCRGRLSVDLRTEWQGVRMLCVAKRATLTCNALAGDYCIPTGRDGRASEVAESGTSRTLCEALECLTAALSAVQNATALPAEARLAYTPGGVQYMTALPRVQRRQ